MRIAVKRVYAPWSESDGFRVLVDRLWPRGVTKDRARIDLWAKDVAPTTELREWFGHDPARWETFRKKYQAELAANAEALEELRSALGGGGKITLVYAARDETRNHALVLRDVLGKNAG